MRMKLAEASRQPFPEVGMGATIMMYTDRHAATGAVLDLSGMGDIKCIGIRRDKAIRIDGNGMSTEQRYRYEPNPSAPLEFYTLRRNGCWVKKGEKSHNGTAIVLGVREEYHDYSF